MKALVVPPFDNSPEFLFCPIQQPYGLQCMKQSTLNVFSHLLQFLFNFSLKSFDYSYFTFQNSNNSKSSLNFPVNGQNPRITSTNIEMFKTFVGMMSGSFLEQVVVVFTRWSMDKKEIQRRLKNTGKTDDQRAREYLNQFKSIFKLQRFCLFPNL